MLTTRQTNNMSPGDAVCQQKGQASHDDADTSRASTGLSSDGSCRLQSWRNDVTNYHQQQQQQMTQSAE